MKSLLPLSLLLLLFVSVARSAEQEPVRALMITGGCCHDYQNQKKIISEGLSARVGDIEWTIVEYGNTREIKADIYKQQNWIEGFDIVLHNECFGAVTDGEFVEGIVKAHVGSGVPAIFIHCSMHSYRTAPTADAWRSLVGVTSRRHERGKRKLTVVPTAEGNDHPITRSLGESWLTPNGELYIIEKVWPKTRVLAQAHSDETGKDEPVIWTNELDDVRVFATTLGHHNETIQDETWQSVVAEGWRWVMKKD